MKPYPSIQSSSSRTVPLGQPCIGFYKYDGSNLRWEWRRKRGFYKMGTRHRLFGADEAPYNQAIPIFGVMSEKVEAAVLKTYKGITEFTVFTEFFGPSSFAGSHDHEEPKKLILIDVWIHQKGLIPPREFLKLFEEHEWTARPVYEGSFNEALIRNVREGCYPVYEGMVCKGTTDSWMAKIKTLAYLQRLKEHFGQDWEKYAE